MSSVHQAVSELLPHQAPMILIDRLCRADDHGLMAQTRVPADSLFDHPEREGWVSAPPYGLECMAQSIAAWDGFRRLQNGQAVRMGLILGARDFRSTQAEFAVGTDLQIVADIVMQSPDGVGVFDCRVEAESGEVLQQARLTVLSVDDLDQIDAKSGAAPR